MKPNPLYEYSHTVGFHALIGRGFNNPVDVAIGRDDVLYVVNRVGPEVEVRIGYKRVTMVTVEEEYLGEFGTGGAGDGQLMWPASIAVDNEGNVYISDEALHRVSVFDWQGRFLDSWGRRGRRPGEFDRPAGIAFDMDDNLLIVDGLNSRVQRFSKDGRFLGCWGQPGKGSGEFNIPWGIATDHNGDVYVADWRNDRIQKFDSDGNHLTTWGQAGDGDGEFNRPSGVAVDSDGNVFIADWGNERVQLLDPEGGFLDKFRGESGVSKWGDDYFVSNQDELEERRKADMEPRLDLSPREESAGIEKLFWGPTSVKIDAHGRVYVVESCRHRIQVYRRKGAGSPAESQRSNATS